MKYVHKIITFSNFAFNVAFLLLGLVLCWLLVMLAMIPSPSSLADRSSHLDDFLNQHFEQTPLDNFKQSFFDQLS